MAANKTTGTTDQAVGGNEKATTSASNAGDREVVNTTTDGLEAQLKLPAGSLGQKMNIQRTFHRPNIPMGAENAAPTKLEEAAKKDTAKQPSAGVDEKWYVVTRSLSHSSISSHPKLLRSMSPRVFPE